jgi:hypothetical protein
MKNYVLQIDINDGNGYFNVEVQDEIILGEEMIDGMEVYRKTWEEVTIKNKPYDYNISAVNGNKLYDLILDSDPDTTFNLKFTCGSDEILGYFGQVDCKINEDKSIITVKPTIIDQYTDFLENYDKEIDIFGLANLVENGDFEVWTAGEPDGWSSLYAVSEKAKVLDRTCIKLNNREYYDPDTHILMYDADTVFQTINNIKSGSSIRISFKTAYIGWALATRRNLEFSVSLDCGTNKYQLSQDGTWINSTSTILIKYRENATAIPLENIEQFNYKEYLPQNIPEDGNIILSFYSMPWPVVAIYLTDVELYASIIPFKNIKVNVLDNKIVSKKQYEILNTKGYNYPYLFWANPRDSEVYPLYDYFNSNGTPNRDLLSNKNHGTHDERDVFYPTIIDDFKDSLTSKFYKGEMMELTMYKGGRWRNRFWLSWRRNIKSIATFAREEYYKTDEYYTAQDELDGLGNEGDLKPPDGGGWEPLDIDPTRGNKRLWVRTPFNGAFTNDWTRDGSIDTSKGKIFDWDWIEKLTSRINYPINENSQSLSTGVNFRDICRKVFRGTHSSLVNKEVYSAFFWNDSPYLAQLIKTDGINYVTGQTNLLNDIYVIHSTDLKPDVELNSDDNKLELSFKDFFDDLNIMFNNSLIWFVDANKNLHIEHKKFIDKIENFVNILDSDYEYINDYSSYEFDKDKIYATTEIEGVNSGYIDFLKSKIEFEKIVSNKRGKDLVKEIKMNHFSTDILYAIENPANLKNGMILCVTHEIDGETIVRYGTGQKSGQSVLNGDLALSTVLSTYGNYEGVWRNGKINDKDIQFKYTLKIKKGEDIKLKGIVPNNFLLTSLGIATATQKKYDYGNEITTFTPVYRHYDFFIVVSENNLVDI